jgi:two-component system phosphate regulon sensor histidine kinase PhoR
MRSSIFRRLIYAALFLVAVTLVAVDTTLTRYAADQQVAAIERRLSSEALILRREAQSLESVELNGWVRTQSQLAKARVTLIREDGAVAADSAGAASGDAFMPDVRQVLTSSSSVVFRLGASNAISVATLLQGRNGERLILRLQMPIGELDSANAGFRWRIFGISVLSSACALALAYAASRSLTQRVRRLKKVAEELLEVPSTGRASNEETDELDALELSLGRVAAQIRSLVDRLRLESARREAILASMAEGVLAVDSDMRVIFSNDAVIRAVGGGRRVQERTRLLELIRDTGLFEMLSDVVKTGEQRKHRLRIVADKERSFEVQAGPLEMPTGQGAIAILYDTTDLERLEQVRKDFVANVSHELRTPLAGIIGYAETLLDGALEDKENNRRFLQIIHSNAIRLNSIASDLLVLSELESKIDPPEAGRIPVRDVVESVLAILEHEASARGVTVIREQIEDVCVMGTRLRLEQAVLNLVANAIKFNQPGGEVRIRVAAAGAARVAITIADTGVGIPSQDLPRIFERFYRVDKGRSRQVGGTGLGLTIVKHVIERMNGSIEVQSQLRKGSTFTAYLPLATNME